ncbi:tRNA (5-methylaminomethyl-2-thiouridine)(34)-methyltransferase MnmD [Rufibacter quisquiliarum]|uniref:tRNA U34 5-methylaminomethyl-2-thiouridine-forming methyltransferase MnmC n=1 Tax=Rufibacter quisquiliarum TaxID=1549639 RepID=A0A839GL05_9BACT|nr:tRNA (5-methylaminomethyl-2-thiouridine)(34)-methyltransferase MnmD [Rufibacter quisquiliarum]MBA9079360.1 tRNA U34 5-methylaminomethyl-2-thiouridine-forming methyltransferase MnmC [Rufibacter quisquiliarum]
MNLEVRQTKDGSTTLFVPELNEHYHSVHGALQESLHVFIKMGLEATLHRLPTVRVLEVGFGTGLNALLTLQHSRLTGATVRYDTLEKYPLAPEVVQQLQFEKFILNPELLDFFLPLHAAPWEQPVAVSPQFTLRKLETDLEAFAPAPEHYDLIYFDAFAPEKQPHLWTDAIFQKMYDCLAPGGTLVTYCAKGSFKRSLKAAGFAVEALPGPPGKREMTRGVKEALPNK